MGLLLRRKGAFEIGLGLGDLCFEEGGIDLGDSLPHLHAAVEVGVNAPDRARHLAPHLYGDQWTESSRRGDRRDQAAPPKLAGVEALRVFWLSGRAGEAEASRERDDGGAECEREAIHWPQRSLSQGCSDTRGSVAAG